MAEDKEKISGKDKFLASLSNFLQKNRPVLIVVLIVMIAAVIGFGVTREIIARQDEKAAGLAEEAQQYYQDWLTEIDDSKKESLEERTREVTDEILRKYPGKYAGQRAHFILASMSFEEEDWEDAAERYIDSAETLENSYLSPIALNNSSVAYEKAGNLESAAEALERIVENYADEFSDLPKVLLNLGRLYEEQEEYESALVNYNMLIDDFARNNWTKIARNRIIRLTVEGMIEVAEE